MTPRRRLVDKKIWWDGADLMANGFLPMILSEGAKNVRVELDMKTKIMTVVDKATAEACGEYDDAHECPIDCPD